MVSPIVGVLKFLSFGILHFSRKCTKNELKMNKSAKLGLRFFLMNLFVTELAIAVTSNDCCFGYIKNLTFLAIPVVFFANIFVLRFYIRGYAYQIALRSIFLSSVMAAGIQIILYAPQPWRVFGWYACVMAFFHFSEFLAIAVCNPQSLSIDSFILNHSVEYGMAAVTSWVEFIIESFFFPELKDYSNISSVGLVMCVLGEILRKQAMYTAKSNFNHVVQEQKELNHVLVTHGVYNWFRHPSYVGWFYWSIGTQVLLLNPFCAVFYTMASWRFFNNRIIAEEASLINFFGKDYINYQRGVGTGLPFIRGYLYDE